MSFHISPSRVFFLSFKQKKSINKLNVKGGKAMSGAIANFFNQKWVKIVSWIMIAIGVIVQLINGVTVGDINAVVEMIFTILQAIGLLVAAIGKLLQKKATTNK